MIRGRATFTLDGEEVDAPAGTIVHLPDPAVRRSAVAEEPGTAVLAVGAKPGEAFQPSPWELGFEASNGAPKEAVAYVEEHMDEYPDSAATTTTSRASARSREIRRARSTHSSGRRRWIRSPCANGGRTTPIWTRSATIRASRSSSHDELGGREAGRDSARGQEVDPDPKHFDGQAFGVNAWVADDEGEDVIGEHTEESTGHEELYLVVSGRATFTLDDEEVDAPAGHHPLRRDDRLAAACAGVVALADDALHRHVVGDRAVGDHHAGRVRADVAVRPLQLAGDVDQLARPAGRCRTRGLKSGLCSSASSSVMPSVMRDQLATAG